MPNRVLPQSFYLDSPDRVARALLGKVLVREPDLAQEERTAGRIVETEAYFGHNDEAAHACRGKTERNAVLFGPPGVAYVYLIYGMYFCLNIACEPEGRAGCVLLRALEPLTGLATMAARRRQSALAAKPDLLASGPGRLCQAMNITRAVHNGLDVTRKGSALSVVDDGYSAGEIESTSRIGIQKATDRLLRYTLAASPFVSKR